MVGYISTEKVTMTMCHEISKESAVKSKHVIPTDEPMHLGRTHHSLAALTRLVRTRAGTQANVSNAEYFFLMEVDVLVVIIMFKER